MSTLETLRTISESNDAIWDEIFSFDDVRYRLIGRYLQRRACGYVFFSVDGRTAKLDDLANAMAGSFYRLMGTDVGEHPLESQVQPIRLLWPYIDALAQSTPEQRQKILLERAVRSAKAAESRPRRM
ncbi:hypothetical protein [uncultured Stenotrophomonas sp.]|uniref:hypothetical protein n=1 Tax=uncultured Stenotrophomonas sp. TaxID=165438 RepID=UPI0028D66242|nr:hypothetical protein [uncultured Stenotrophomonas sp.]